MLWRQESFVVHRFQWLVKTPHLFPDQAQFRQLVTMGQKAAEDDDMQKLREVVAMMSSVRIYLGGDAGLSEDANIIIACPHGDRSLDSPRVFSHGRSGLATLPVRRGPVNGECVVLGTSV